ncbi:TcfC E-set like domain-containing protein [Yersinia massiliensis]|uniref:TcfC E-set like domain-containing protein n=1 Tax=Yersinia massiliensis TaxID=419257 RepID=UPI001CFC53AC|nr:TcfC E-set like domain-containing protein [Yersinia massiliensis]MCB5309651.1 TcfC E-set like domain-containing protein [Yersinia massiliensis]
MEYILNSRYVSVAAIPLCFIPSLSLSAENKTQIEGVVIPHAFAQALRGGMTLPLLLRYKQNNGGEQDQKIGTALLQLEGNNLVIRQVNIEHSKNGARLSDETLKLLAKIDGQVFIDNKTIPVSDVASLDLQLKQLTLQLTVQKNALGLEAIQRSEDIGRSSIENLSSTLNYTGSLSNRINGGNSGNSSSYLSLNSMTGYREHHFDVTGALYGLTDDDNRQGKLYKAMYERDTNGRRFAAGMVDSWNLQSIGPVTGLNASQIYGLSYGSEANSTVFDNSQSLTPIIAFLPSAGEVRLFRDGRLLSVQQFEMGNHELNTASLPYGMYDVEMEIIVNGQVVEKRTQSVNKLFTPTIGNGGKTLWQLWGGAIHFDEWQRYNDSHTYERDYTQKVAAQKTYLVGASAAGNFRTLSWGGSAYSFDNNPVIETRLNFPASESVNISMQNMLSADNSWGVINSINSSLPGNFSSVWLSQQRSDIGDKLRQAPNDSYSLGVNVNFTPLVSSLGNLSVSYNNDRRNNNRYYNASYSQNVMTNRYGRLGLRLGMQQRANRENENNDSGKYVALDFSMPTGHWFSAGMSHQNGRTTANLAARQQVDMGIIRSIGGNVSHTVKGKDDGQRAFNGGFSSRYESKYLSGNANASSSDDGSINATLNGEGSIGWQGKYIAASGRSDGSAGVIIDTGNGLGKEGRLTAKVNDRNIELTGQRNYIPLPPYAQYEVQIINNNKSSDNFDIGSQAENKFILYPGNVAVIEPQIKQMVTVSGVIKNKEGNRLDNMSITNSISQTTTDKNGEFIMDIDKHSPVIKLKNNDNRSCVVELNLSEAKGAAWVGDVICDGLTNQGVS